MTVEKIPKATAKRLPIYYRYLNILYDSGTNRISSTELAKAVQVDSATIRRDFSYFGALGKRGYGYDVEHLIMFFKRILNQEKQTNVALIGIGNLGRALLNFNFHQDGNIRVSAAFDVREDVINRVIEGIPVFPVDTIEEQLKNQDIQVVILTVPAHAAQEMADKLVSIGIKGIMNFTPIRISVPSDVLVQNVDLTNELQTLIYFIDNYKNNADTEENN